MEISDLTKKIKEQGIKEGDAIEITVHVDPKFEERAIREFDYKTIGYFEDIKDMGDELPYYRGHLLSITRFKKVNHGVPHRSPDSAYVTDILEIKKLE